MDPKTKKKLFIGGGVAAVAAIFLFAGSSSASERKKTGAQDGPQPGPGTGPKTGPGPVPSIEPAVAPGKPPVDERREDDVVKVEPTSTPFGAVACEGGQIAPGYRGIIERVMTSYDQEKLRYTMRAAQAIGCDELAAYVAERTGNLLSTAPDLPEIGRPDSWCDPSGELVDGVEKEKVARWISTLMDASIARQAADRLASSGCDVLASSAAQRADALDAAATARQASGRAAQSIGDAFSNFFS